MAKLAVARNNSVSAALGHAQDAFGSMKLMGRSMSELRLGRPNFEPPGSHGRTSSWVDLPDNHSGTISSSINPTLKRRKGASKGNNLNITAVPESKRLGRWWDDLRHRHDRKKIDEPTTGQKKPVQTKEPRSVSTKASMWKRLLLKLKGQAQRIRPARSDSMTSQESKQAYPLPRSESSPLPRTKEAVDREAYPLPRCESSRMPSSKEAADFSSSRSRILPSQLLQIQKAVPLWQRRKARQPAPLDSRATIMNRNRRRSQKL